MNIDLQQFPEWAQNTIYFCTDYLEWFSGLALLLFILLVFSMLVRFVRGKGKDVLAFEDESGRVSISKYALKTLIFNKCNRVPGVQNPRPSIKMTGNKIAIYVKVGIQEGCNLREVREILRTHLEESLRCDFGLEKLSSIHVLVTDFETKYASEDSTALTLSSPVTEIEQDAVSSAEDSESLDWQKEKKDSS